MSGAARVTVRSLSVLLAACSSTGTPLDIARTRDPLVGPVTAFASLGDRVYACSQAGIARIDADAPVLSCAPDFRVVALTADVRDGSLLAAGGTPATEGVVARIEDGQVIARSTLSTDLVSCITVDPGNRSVIVGCDDGRVLALDPRSLSITKDLRRHGGPVRAVALHGALLASAGLDGNVLLGPIGGSPQVLRDHTAGVECAVWSADGSVLATGSRDGRVRLHDRDGRLLQSTEPLRARVLALAPAADGRFLCGLEDGRLLGISATPGEEPQELARYDTAVHGIATQPPIPLVGLAGAIAVVPSAGYPPGAERSRPPRPARDAAGRHASARIACSARASACTSPLVL